MKKTCWVAIFIILFAGCGSSSSSELKEGVGLIPGSVYENVRCKTYPSYSYAIYLPSSYRSSDSLPVFLAFDPAGSGVRPVERYKEIAETYGFILIGSNDSRNGQGADILEQIIFALLTELRGRYAVDLSRVYCTGFSGGSRVSSILAFYRGGFKGVIGCGAGLPYATAPVRHQTDYYGIVGDQDFNYLEMINLANDFNQKGLRNSFRIFHGPHEWPPAADFEAAIRWHWYHAMGDGIIPPDPSLTASAEKEMLENAAFLESIDLKELEKERKRQLAYTQSMKEKTPSWWLKEVKKLEHPANPADSLINRRLISFMSIIAYSYSSKALESKDKAELTRLIGIYKAVDPENTYISYLKEQLNALP